MSVNIITNSLILGVNDRSSLITSRVKKNLRIIEKK